MPSLLFAQEPHMDHVRELFSEYASTLDFDLSFQNFAEELDQLPGEYANPQGALLLAYENEEPVGCVALRALNEEVAEMKRLYVRDSFRGQGFGRYLVYGVMKVAQEKGYKKMRLDTVPSMEAAQSLYLKLGFRPIEPYCENPVPGATFLEIRF